MHYDYFVSYSHQDSDVVRRLATLLSRARVRLWWDRWEMAPGDVLRERINAGIEASRGYIVIVSPHSLNSPWVQHELNAAFIRSIEERAVRLIAALVGDVEFSDLPIDLRTRYGLDFRTPAVMARGIEQLVQLAHPERRERAAL